MLPDCLGRNFHLFSDKNLPLKVSMTKELQLPFQDLYCSRLHNRFSLLDSGIWRHPFVDDQKLGHFCIFLNIYLKMIKEHIYLPNDVLLKSICQMTRQHKGPGEPYFWVFLGSDEVPQGQVGGPRPLQGYRRGVKIPAGLGEGVQKPCRAR